MGPDPDQSQKCPVTSRVLRGSGPKGPLESMQWAVTEVSPGEKREKTSS